MPNKTAVKPAPKVTSAPAPKTVAAASPVPGTTLVQTGSCKPFSLQVMVYSPESGYKFEVNVVKGCTSTNDVYWQLVFDLYKKQATGTDFDKIVHVAFTSGTPAETAGVQAMAFIGVTPAQASAMETQVYPAAKPLEGNATPTPEEKAALHAAMSAAATAVSVDV